MRIPKAINTFDSQKFNILDYDALGLDLETLIEWKVDKITQLIGDCCIQCLTETEMGYEKGLTKFSYDPSLTKGFGQGSVWDLKNGTLLNLSSQEHITSANLGHKKLTTDEIKELYGHPPIFNTVWPESNLCLNKNPHWIVMSRIEAFYIPFICHMVDLISKNQVHKTYI